MQCKNGKKNMSNLDQPIIETKRFLLRAFQMQDAEAVFTWLGNESVTKFLPMFFLQSLEEARQLLKEWIESDDLRYAIVWKGEDKPIGYVSISDSESHDFGYALHESYWHQGIVTEAARAVMNQVKDTLPFLSATHDVLNPRSGAVMRKLGMNYCYSYEELWMPKQIKVTFRMYQINFDGSDHVYQGYANRYPHHVEQLEMEGKQ